MYHKEASIPPIHDPFLTYLTLQKVVQHVHATGPLVSLLELWDRLPRQYMRDKFNALFPSLSGKEFL